MGKINENLLDIRKQGAVSASVIISLVEDGDVSAKDFELPEEVFTQEGQMKTISAVWGTLQLSELEAVADRDEVKSIDRNSEISLPDDPSAPQ